MKITKFYKCVYLAGIGSGVIWWENKDEVLSCISALGGLYVCDLKKAGMDSSDTSALWV